MGDGEVGWENRHGIAENQVISSVKDSFLVFRKMIQTEKTLPLLRNVLAHLGCTALDPHGIILKANGKSFTRNISLFDIPK
jgi:hypothetical protein